MRAGARWSSSQRELRVDGLREADLVVLDDAVDPVLGLVAVLAARPVGDRARGAGQYVVGAVAPGDVGRRARLNHVAEVVLVVRHDDLLVVDHDADGRGGVAHEFPRGRGGGGGRRTVDRVERDADGRACLLVDHAREDEQERKEGQPQAGLPEEAVVTAAGAPVTKRRDEVQHEAEVREQAREAEQQGDVVRAEPVQHDQLVVEHGPSLVGVWGCEAGTKERTRSYSFSGSHIIVRNFDILHLFSLFAV